MMEKTTWLAHLFGGYMWFGNQKERVGGDEGRKIWTTDPFETSYTSIIQTDSSTFNTYTQTHTLDGAHTSHKAV